MVQVPRPYVEAYTGVHHQPVAAVEQWLRDQGRGEDAEALRRAVDAVGSPRLLQSVPVVGDAAKFKTMLAGGAPESIVRRAMERDGHDRRAIDAFFGKRGAGEAAELPGYWTFHACPACVRRDAH